jgi:streptogramin lyase
MWSRSRSVLAVGVIALVVSVGLAAGARHAAASRSRCVVPELLEDALPAAKRAIRHHGCRVGRIRFSYSSLLPKGQVLSQHPLSHSVRKRGTRVNLVVSRGLPPHVLARVAASSPEGVLGAFGSVWIANHREGQVSRIDPSTRNVIATMPAEEGVGGPTPDQNAVWFVGEEDGTITRADPATNQSTTFQSPYLALCGQSAAVPGALWVDVCGDSGFSAFVARIDTTTHKTTAQVATGDGVDTMVTDGTNVWIATYDPGQVLEIDGATGTVLRDIPVEGCPQITPDSLANGYLWVGQRDGDDTEPCTGSSSVLRIDTTSGATQTVPVGGPSTVATGGGTVWAAVEVSATTEALLRIDPTALTTTTWTKLPMKEQPDGFTYISNELWVGFFDDYSAWVVNTT